MGSSFNRWEKDPFFSAAEEVQESSDRMESTYRTWIHAKKDSSSMWDSAELRRDLRTALGTTKWQLEEFERAVGSSYANSSADDAKDRHREFILAMENQISTVEKSLKESAISEGKPPLPWVRLDEGERNELALFLSGPSASEHKSTYKTNGRVGTTNPKEMDKESPSECSRNSCQSSEQALLESLEEKLKHGHRRTASASAEIGAWKIAITGDFSLQDSSNGQPPKPPRKVPSFSGLLSSMETASKLKWSKNGFRKLKAVDHHQEADAALLQTPQLTKGINACYERTKSCLDSCEECYDKQLYGWYGAIQRQLQRSQYQMQYSRPIRVTLWVALILCLMILFALRAI